MATASQSLDEKSITKISRSDQLSSVHAASLNSLLKLYKKEQHSSSGDDIIVELVIVIIQLVTYHDIIFGFADLVLKIKKIKDPSSEQDRLQTVLEDIKKLGRTILKLNDDHPSIITEIVTNALQPKEKKTFHESASGIVTINPKPRKGLLSQFIDWTLDHVLKFLNHKKSGSEYLEGNYAPVRQETPPTANLIIKGQLPKYLNGVMVRNGPNPQFDPIANYSWLDGDSMLHSVYFKEGKATYASQYVKTSRFKQEQVFGRGEFLQYGDLIGSFGVFMACVQLLKQKLGILDTSQGWFNANTGAVYHAGFLMVSEDFDKPYAINVKDNGDLETLGINNYHNKFTGHFVAHPKKDSDTEEMFILSASYKEPYATYSIITKDGYVRDQVNIPGLSRPTYNHDFGITKNYVIVMDLSLCFNPEIMVKNAAWVYSFDHQKNARFGILPRSETSEKKITWFGFDKPFVIFHNANSWEEDKDTIVLISCLTEEHKPKDSLKSQTKYGAHGYPWIFYSPGSQRRSSTLQSGSKDDKPVTKLNKLLFNMKTGKCTQHALSETHCEYPKVNEKYIGRKSRYVYTTEFNKDAKAIGIAKTDLQWESELKLNIGKGKYGSEVTFVSNQSITPCEEDDGYLTTFVYDEPNSKSFAYVICARKMEVLATVELKNIRVPYGFHATFVTEKELKAQKKLVK